MAVKKLTGDIYGLAVDYDELSIKKAVISFMRTPNLDTFTQLVCSGVTEEHIRGYRLHLDWGVFEDIGETIRSMEVDVSTYFRRNEVKEQYFNYFSSVLSLAPWIVHYLSDSIFNNLNSRVKSTVNYRESLTDDLLDEVIIRRLRGHYYNTKADYSEPNHYNELYLDLKHIDRHTYKHPALNTFDRGMYNGKFTNILSESILNNYDGGYRVSTWRYMDSDFYVNKDRSINLIKSLVINSRHNVVKDIGKLLLNHVNLGYVLAKSEVIYKGPTEPCRDGYSVFSSQGFQVGDFFNMHTKYYEEFLDY